MSETQWSSVPPTEPGWYWVKFRRFSGGIFCLKECHGGIHWLEHGGPEHIPLDWFAAEGAEFGPKIEPPDSPTPAGG